MSLTRVTNRVIEDNAVVTTKIANNAITTAKIIDNAITETKIANGAISRSKLSGDIFLGSPRAITYGSVKAIFVTSTGSSYTTVPTVQISAPELQGGVQATAVATIGSGAVTGITITNEGFGYTSDPTVTITGGGGTGGGAEALANYSPVPLTPLRTLASSSILTTDGVIYVTGASTSSGLGRSNRNAVAGDVWSPMPIYVNNTNLNYYPFFIKHWHTNYNLYALDTFGGLWAAGQNVFGQLGNGTTVAAATLTPQMELINSSFFNNSPVINFSVNPACLGNETFCVARTANGNLFTWGHNIQGQLGLGDVVSRSIPTQVPGQTDVSKVYSFGAGSTGMGAIFLLKKNGTAFSAGNNTNSQLGHGDNSPALVNTFNIVKENNINTTMTGIKDIFATPDRGNNLAVYFLKTNNTLWSVGANNTGQLGQGDAVGGATAGRKVAVQVLTNVKMVVPSARLAATASVHVLDNNNILRVSGFNLSGRLGLGDAVQRNAFTQTGTNDIIFVDAGCERSVYINNKNEIFTTGNNVAGQLGLGDVTLRNIWSRVPFKGIPLYARYFGGALVAGEFLLVVDIEGRVHTCGVNTSGQLGHGSIRDAHMLAPYLLPN